MARRPANTPRRGRGANENPDGRFEAETRSWVDDGWSNSASDAPEPLKTEVRASTPRSVLSGNDSPDIPFRLSINPYQGCEHGCSYCYARPAHAYLGLSPGLDFETRLIAKTGAAEVLARELGRKGHQVSTVALGANTDPYQPVERRLGITREILEVLAEARHPVVVITKNALVERDIELLASLAGHGSARVFLSITSLDSDLSRRLEPRASRPARRVEAIRRLSEAGIPAGVMFAPVIPALNEHELEAVLEAAAGAGARHAGYVMLRLPREVRPLFKRWLEDHEPLKAARVMAIVRELRDGRENDSTFGRRLVGQGPFAELLRQRFRVSCRRLGLDAHPPELDASHFRPPGQAGQRSLF